MKSHDNRMNCEFACRTMPTLSRPGAVYSMARLNGKMLCCYPITPYYSPCRGDSVRSRDDVPQSSPTITTDRSPFNIPWPICVHVVSFIFTKGLLMQLAWGKGAVAKFFFAAALLLHPEHSISRPRLPVTAQIFILGHSKADRGIFPGLPVDNFLCSTTTKLFSQNNGFPACFFAASSTAS